MPSGSLLGDLHLLIDMKLGYKLKIPHLYYLFGPKSSVELEKGYQLYRVACLMHEIYCSQISTVEVGGEEHVVEDYPSWLCLLRELAACGQSLWECSKASFSI